ncbi:substrate-binding domain-containing protein [Novosphingobium sp. FSY-8]|uniref:Substrate-binding domain-containing protein n=1 Tax=Novosphingobium ovatum TaxID=1908523 RepID=A0ABW9XH38_9SPHN|nr:LacI family DNA-binding transcriptional regulator [Novosphingobium ovatum]NBC37875.1 substrate-binding domain-containing protein [Novosphingobium ovatum]
MANIKDIAAMAGVSIATVSRALRQPGLVKDKTAAKIEEAIRELDYKPNLVAASLRRQKADAVIIAVPSIHNPFTSSFVEGVENVARENGTKVLLAITESRSDLLDRHYEMIAGKQADGMILLDLIEPSDLARKVAGASPLPIVLACEYQDGKDQPRVRVNDVDAAADAAAHIAGLGHTRIACLSGPSVQRMSRDRQRGFRLGLRRAGLELAEDLIVAGDYSLQSGVESTFALLDRGHPFTAILCENDEMALGAIHALAVRGLRVPQDVSVIGIDNMRFAAFSNPALTTVSLPTTAIGEQAMRLMLDFAIDADGACREIILPHQLIKRESTCPPQA